MRVLMGNAFGTTSPVPGTYADTLYIEAQLQPGQSLLLPEATARALYVVSGAVRIGSVSVEQHDMAVLTEERIRISDADTRIALIGGENPGERYILWNFVSSRRERIQQAKADWQAGRFPKVPEMNRSSYPLPEERHIATFLLKNLNSC